MQNKLLERENMGKMPPLGPKPLVTNSHIQQETLSLA